MEIETDSIVQKNNESASLRSIEHSGRNSYINKNWIPEEDTKLLNFVDETKSHNWKKIASILGNKTAQQCAYRYNKLKSDTNKSKWNRNEDIQLLEMIESYGQNWAYIASQMPSRSAEDVMQRYILKLDPKLKRSRFEKEEDELILKLHDKYGNKWNEISKYLPNRNSAMIKNRYYSYLKKKYKESNTVETLSNYELSMNTPTSLERHTHSFNDNNGLKNRLGDCDIEMLDQDLNSKLTMNIPTIIEYSNSVTDINSNSDGNPFTNQLPSELMKVDQNSPKQKILESDDNFDIQYNSVFAQFKKKDSYEDSPDEYYVKQNNIQKENENLFQQYQLLESVFKKVYEVSTFQVNHIGYIY
jgi:hypothetical protein